MMRAADELAWCEFLRQVIHVWGEHDSINCVAQRLSVRQKRVYKALCWLQKAGVAKKVGEQRLQFCRRDLYAVDVERAEVAIRQRVRLAKKESSTQPTWPSPIEAAMAGMVRQRAVSRRVKDGRQLKIAEQDSLLG